jgi:hypothetical protein
LFGHYEWVDLDRENGKLLRLVFFLEQNLRCRGSRTAAQIQYTAGGPYGNDFVQIENDSEIKKRLEAKRMRLPKLPDATKDLVTIDDGELWSLLRWDGPYEVWFRR